MPWREAREEHGSKKETGFLSVSCSCSSAAAAPNDAIGYQTQISQAFGIVVQDATREADVEFEVVR